MMVRLIKLLTLVFVVLYTSNLYAAACSAVIAQGSTESCNIIAQYGITWTLTANETVGQFITGDYFIVDDGDVEVFSVDPPIVLGVNGSMVNPVGDPAHEYNNYYQAYYDNVLYGWYDEDLCVTFPLAMSGGESLISTIGKTGQEWKDWDGTGASNNSYIYSAAVLTVLDSQPASGTFRPGYCGTDKTLYNISDIDTSVLQDLDVSGLTYDDSPWHYYEDDYLERGVQRPWIMNSPDFTGQQIIPIQNQLGYHRDQGLYLNQVMLALHTTTERTDTLLYSFLQTQIDTYELITNGGGPSVIFNAPLTMAGVLLQDAGMAAISAGREGSTFLYCDGWTGATACFQKDEKCPDCIHPSSWSSDECRAESYRGNSGDSGPYPGFALAIHLGGNPLIDAYEFDAMLGYAERFVSEPFVEEFAPIANPYCVQDFTGGYQSKGSSFATAMWDEYYTSFGSPVYYVDIDHPSASNANAGTDPDLPWETLTYASVNVPAGATVNVAAGDYGEVVFDASSSRGTADNWITYIGTNDTLFKSLVVSATAETNMYIEFQGMYLKHDYVAGYACAGEPPNIQNTCGTMLSVGPYVSYLRFKDMEIEGFQSDYGYPGSVHGIDVNNGVKHVTFDGLELHWLHWPIVYGYATASYSNEDIRIINTYIHDYSSSGISSFGGLDLIENTVIADEIGTTWDSTHGGGSGLAMRKDNITIRNVVIRNAGATSAITFYYAIHPIDGYSNVTLENVITYETRDTGFNIGVKIQDHGKNFNIINCSFPHGLQIWQAVDAVASDLVFRNNLVRGFSYHNEFWIVDNTPECDTKTWDRYASSSELSCRNEPELESPTCDPCGDLKTPTEDLGIIEKNNIISWWVTAGAGYQVDLISAGYLDPTSWYAQHSTGDFDALFVSSTFQVENPSADYHLVAGSKAINFGDADYQPSDALGIFGVDNFLIPTGTVRGPDNHSAGAYEYGSAPPVDPETFEVQFVMPTGQVRFNQPFGTINWTE